MEVGTGFKKTEVGVIPSDWGVSALGDIIEHTKGFAFKAQDYQSHGVRILRVSDTTSDSIKDNGGIYIDDAKAKGFGRWSLREGDLIVSTVGSKPPMYDSMVGKATFVHAKDSGALLNQNAVILRSKKGMQSLNKVLHNHFKTSRYLAHIEKIFRGNANQASITLSELFEYLLPLPPTLAEQTAIATALSDADALIEALEHLIAKKRHIKQGAMQELLTGKKRLPGFSGKWAERKLCEVCWFQEGPGVRNTQFTASGVKLLNGTNIFRGVLNLDTTNRFISEKEAFGAYAHFLAEDGDIVIASSGITIERFHEKVAFVTKANLPFCMNTSTIRFKPTLDALQPTFLFQFLISDTFKKMIGGQATGSAQLNFGPSHVAKISLSLPSLLEQAAIATVLSDMDTEIATLETKLTKAIQIKQGMMHNLLTGRIRLI